MSTLADFDSVWHYPVQTCARVTPSSLIPVLRVRTLLRGGMQPYEYGRLVRVFRVEKYRNGAEPHIAGLAVQM